MVEIPSSHGGTVTVEIKGIAEAIRKIREKGQDILRGKDAKTLQAANFVQQEIQESIVGNRVEPKSVATGNFANSIEVSKIKEGEYSVYTDVEYAKFLEYGTSKLTPRSHFRNTVNRNRAAAITIIKGK